MPEYDEVAVGIRRVTILNGASQSNALDIGITEHIGLIMPSAWTSAVITFLVCATADGTFQPLYNQAGTEVSLTVAVDKAYSLETAAPMLAPWKYLKARSGTAGTPVNQGGDRILMFIVKY